MNARYFDAPAETARFRAAARQDCTRIAELFRHSSDGVADYVWSLQAQPGESLLSVGARRFARRNTEFSYENCLVADFGNLPVGMMHSYPMHPDGRVPPPPEDMDPVLRPYAELEWPRSLYISGLAMLPGYRGYGLGSAFLARAMEQAVRLGLPHLSLIAFEQNHGAVRLYERHGYRIVDRRRVVPHPFIHFDGDALLMVLTL